MAAFSIAYLSTLKGLCWSSEQINAAVADADYPENPTWSFFIGERLRNMTREDCMARLALVIAHAHQTKVQFPPEWTHPRRLGEQWALAKTCTDEELFTYLADLGAVLDAA
jgi:hypothetical protein